MLSISSSQTWFCTVTNTLLLIPFILAPLVACQDSQSLPLHTAAIINSTTQDNITASSFNATSPSSAAAKACRILSQRFPDLIAFPGSQQYVDDEHHAAYSSQQNSTCTIEPRSIEDVSEILKIVGQDDIRSPFAVKSGGHAYNLGFSSTPGVLISMTQFNQVTYTPPSSSSSSFSSVLSSSPASSPSPLSSFGPSPASSSSSSRSSSLVSSNSSRSFPPSRSNSFSSSSSSSSVSSSSSSLPLPPPSAQFPNLGTITLGTGLTWDVVYARLEALGLGLNVAGGRIPGIGVGGFTLGGGYSWHTDQYGLSIDTVASFDLVLPTGEIVEGVSANKRPDLYWGLKGGMNNLGIVTAITYYAFRQDLVYGGSISFSQNVSTQVYAAVSRYDQTNTDPKSQLLLTFAGVAGQPILQLFLFYDAPELPETFKGYEEFFAIPAVANAVKGGQRFSSYLTGTYGDGSLGIGTYGIAQHVIPIRKYTPSILSIMASSCTNLSSTIPSLLADFAKENANNSRFVGLGDVGSIIGLVSVSAEPFINAFAHPGVEIDEGVFGMLGLDDDDDNSFNSTSSSRPKPNPGYPDPYPGSNVSLYAHSATHPTTPASLLVAYSLPLSIQSSETTVKALQERVFKGVLEKLTAEIWSVAIEEGEGLVAPGTLGAQDVDVSSNGASPGPNSNSDSVIPLLYPNYAFAGTPLEAMYGPTNVRRMKRLVKSVDPEGVMGLTGGFLFQ